MIVMKKALPRRTFLRGVGATLALPLLDAKWFATAKNVSGSAVAQGLLENHPLPAPTSATTEASAIPTASMI